MSHLELEEPESGEEGEEDGHGEDTEDDRDHHRDLLLAAGLHDLAAALLPDVLRLGPEDLGQGCAALDRDDDPVDESGQRSQTGAVGEAMEGDGQAGAGTGIAESAAELV